MKLPDSNSIVSSVGLSNFFAGLGVAATSATLSPVALGFLFAQNLAVTGLIASKLRKGDKKIDMLELKGPAYDKIKEVVAKKEGFLSKGKKMGPLIPEVVSEKYADIKKNSLKNGYKLGTLKYVGVGVGQTLSGNPAGPFTLAYGAGRNNISLQQKEAETKAKEIDSDKELRASIAEADKSVTEHSKTKKLDKADKELTAEEKLRASLDNPDKDIVEDSKEQKDDKSVKALTAEESLRSSLDDVDRDSDKQPHKQKEDFEDRGLTAEEELRASIAEAEMEKDTSEDSRAHDRGDSEKIQSVEEELRASLEDSGRETLEPVREQDKDRAEFALNNEAQLRASLVDNDKANPAKDKSHDKDEREQNLG